MHNIELHSHGKKVNETVHIWVTEQSEESDTKLHNREWDGENLGYTAMGKKWYKIVKHRMKMSTPGLQSHENKVTQKCIT